MRDLILRTVAVFLTLLIVAVAVFALAVSIPVVADNGELAAGLVGGAAALTAAWLAWEAVQRQIDVGRASDREERQRRLVTALEVVVTVLMVTANFAKSVSPPAPLPEWLGSWAQPTIPAAMEAHPILGSCLQGHLMDLDAFRRQLEKVSQGAGFMNVLAEEAFGRLAIEFAYRTFVLASAFSKCVTLLEQGLPISMPPLLSSTEVERVSTDFGVPPGPILYLAPIITDDLADVADMAVGKPVVHPH